MQDRDGRNRDRSPYLPLRGFFWKRGTCCYVPFSPIVGRQSLVDALIEITGVSRFTDTSTMPSCPEYLIAFSMTFSNACGRARLSLEKTTSVIEQQPVRD